VVPARQVVEVVGVEAVVVGRQKCAGGICMVLQARAVRQFYVRQRCRRRCRRHGHQRKAGTVRQKGMQLPPRPVRRQLSERMPTAGRQAARPGVR